MEKELICINCPLGCNLTVVLNDGKEIISVHGNNCPRGEAYAKIEVVSPRRTVTSTVKLEGGKIARVPVKTEIDIPKNLIFPVMEEIKGITVSAPVRIGDVIKKNIASSNVDLVATRNIERE